jgi:thiol-disulfide isomerase/thioredoxin
LLNHYVASCKQAAHFCGLFVALLVMGMSARVGAQQGKWVAENTAPPALALKDMNGRELNLSAFKGKVVVLNFWATWCGPCVAEMPSLQTLSRRYADKSLVVLGVNYHESTEKVKSFQRRYNIDFPLARDPWQEASAAWNVRILPESFVVDAEGKLRYRVTGEVDWASAEVAERLRPLLAAPKPAMQTLRPLQRETS